MSIFKHINHPVFDENSGVKGQSSINPQTGNREYFLGALLSTGLRAAIPTVMRTAIPAAIRTGVKVGTRAAGTAIKTGARYAGQAGKIASRTAGTAIKSGSRAAGQIGRSAGTAIKSGSRVAGQAGRAAGTAIKSGGQFVARNALPAATAAGKQLAAATPDILNGVGMYMQQKSMMDQQNNMMNLMANMAVQNNQGYAPQQQYAPQEQQMPQEQYAPQEQEAPQGEYFPQEEQFNQDYGAPQQMDQYGYASGNYGDPYADQQPYYGDSSYDSLQNPDQYRPNYAHGGRAYVEKLKKAGRYGDTEIGLMPNFIQDQLNIIRGGKTVNPKTGLQENFLPLLMGMASMMPSVIEMMQGRSTAQKKYRHSIHGVDKSVDKGAKKFFNNNPYASNEYYEQVKAARGANRAANAKATRDRLGSLTKSSTKFVAPPNSQENWTPPTGDGHKKPEAPQPAAPAMDQNQGMQQAPSFDQGQQQYDFGQDQGIYGNDSYGDNSYGGQYQPQYEPQYEPQQYQPQQSFSQPQQPQQPQQLVSDDVVHKRIAGVMNRAPDIINRMHQEFQGANQPQR